MNGWATMTGYPILEVTGRSKVVAARGIIPIEAIPVKAIPYRAVAEESSPLIAGGRRMEDSSK